MQSLKAWKLIFIVFQEWGNLEKKETKIRALKKFLLPVPLSKT